MIKNIIFDMDGVILDSFKSNCMFNSDVMKLGGFPKPSSKQLKIAHTLSFRQVIKLFLPNEDEKTYEKMFKIGTEIYPKYIKYIKLMKDCKKTLIELSEKFRLAIVTGRRMYSVKLIFEKFDIKNFFDVVVTYDIYNKPKPDPEPLLVALKKLKSKPEESLYIGDGEVDVQAAKAAGIKVIIISNREVSGADFYIDSLTEIKSIL